MRRFRSAGAGLKAALLHRIGSFVMLILLSVGCASTAFVLRPGRLADGRVLLPNGWLLSPAGRQVPVGELPLNMDMTPDGRYVVVANNGTSEQSVSVIETSSWRIVQTIPVRASWLGVRFFEQGRKFLLSGGNENRVYLFTFDRGKAALADSIVLGPPWPARKIWVAGLDVDEVSRRVFVCGKQNDSLYVADLGARGLICGIPLPGTPYTCLSSKQRNLLYVSLWGAAGVAVLDRSSLRLLGTVTVGDHPNDMVESPDGRHLFVANGNLNTVSVIDLDHRRVIETISSAIEQGAPPGSTPNSLALSADGKRLYIANADNNYIAVLDLVRPGHSRALGLIPVGWYPTCVRVLPRTGEILVANGKGSGSRPNPKGPVPGVHDSKAQYIGSLFRGTVSSIPPPTRQRLGRYTQLVYRNSPYRDRTRDNPGTGGSNPIPQRVGDPSPIKHVFYIIKENRTYDQIFGDLPQGNGDKSLCLFPESITPNHHALAKQFVILDNLYADAEVSADGHNWSMGAYANDYVEKTWPTSYGGRGGEYTYEGGDPLVYPREGYLWDDCRRHGVSYRTYGEFVENGATPADTCTAQTASLRGHVAPLYRGWDLDYSDTSRVRAWIREFDAYERDGNLPRFQIIKLPNDHTYGAKKGKLTPRAYLAQNDLALGMFIDRLSHSRYWKDSAVFVIEDDAQNGPDHVDAHRTVALVISPYARRGFVDHTMYSTAGMVRTMELILGLPPLSQFDASARPMYRSFGSTPDLTPYAKLGVAVDLNERNPANAETQEQSERMDFTHQDAAPDLELNEVIWKSIRGPYSEMPPPVRSACVFPRESE
jgi:YVTN family beta-propeller protein